MAYIIAFATLISLPFADYLIKKKGYSYPKAMSAALLVCWTITAVVSLLIKWVIL